MSDHTERGVSKHLKQTIPVEPPWQRLGVFTMHVTSAHQNFTCSGRALPGQAKESFLLKYKTASNKEAGADGQSKADVEIVFASVLAHGSL